MISFFKHGSIQGTFLLANRVRQKMKMLLTYFSCLSFSPGINVSVSLRVTQSLRVSILRCHLTKGIIRITLATTTGIRGDLMKFSNVLIHFNYSITKKSLAALSLQNASSRSSHEIETVRVYLFNSV